MTNEECLVYFWQSQQCSNSKMLHKVIWSLAWINRLSIYLDSWDDLQPKATVVTVGVIS